MHSTCGGCVGQKNEQADRFKGVVAPKIQIECVRGWYITWIQLKPFSHLAEPWKIDEAYRKNLRYKQTWAVTAFSNAKCGFNIKILEKRVLSKVSSYLTKQSLQHFSASISSWSQH